MRTDPFRKRCYYNFVWQKGLKERSQGTDFIEIKAYTRLPVSHLSQFKMGRQEPTQRKFANIYTFFANFSTPIVLHEFHKPMFLKYFMHSVSGSKTKNLTNNTP